MKKGLLELSAWLADMNKNYNAGCKRTSPSSTTAISTNSASSSPSCGNGTRSKPASKPAPEPYRPGSTTSGPPPETAAQALYLYDFYFNTTIPFLEIDSEQDRLAGERKLVDLLVCKYGGKALHSSLLNSSHMRKREFNECIAGLIDWEAVSVEAVKLKNGNTGKVYLLNDEIMRSWGK